MCYKYPGPKCSSQLATELAYLKADLKTSKHKPSSEEHKTLNLLIEKKQKEYEATPAGLKELERRSRQSYQPFIAKSKLEAATKVYEQNLETIKELNLPMIKHVNSSGDDEKEVKFYDILTPQNFSNQWCQLLQETYDNDNIEHYHHLIQQSSNWVNKLTADEIEATAWFTNDGYQLVNQYILNNYRLLEDHKYNETQNTPEIIEHTITQLDTALKKNKTNETYHLFRGISGETLLNLFNRTKFPKTAKTFNKLVKEVFIPETEYVSPTFMSSTASLSVASRFTGHVHTNYLLFELLTKKAGPATNISGWGLDEQEYILPRNHSYLIEDVKHIKLQNRDYHIVQLVDNTGENNL